MTNNLYFKLYCYVTPFKPAAANARSKPKAACLYTTFMKAKSQLISEASWLQISQKAIKISALASRVGQIRKV